MPTMSTDELMERIAALVGPPPEPLPRPARPTSDVLDAIDAALCEQWSPVRRAA